MMSRHQQGMSCPSKAICSEHPDHIVECLLVKRQVLAKWVQLHMAASRLVCFAQACAPTIETNVHGRSIQCACVQTLIASG